MAANGNGASPPLRIYDLQPSPGVCPYVQKSKITLQEKQLKYETVYIDKNNKAKDFLDLFRSITSNPQHRGTVPILIDGDVRIAESDIVSEYLDNKYADHGTKLFPTDPYKLALVRLFVNNYTTQVQPAGANIFKATTQQEYKDAIAAFTDGLKILDTFLKSHGEGGDFLLSTFSYAEAGTLPFFYRAAKTLPDWRGVNVDKLIKENGLTHLQKWKEAGFARASLKGTLPPDDIIVEKGSFLVTVALKDLK